jgi:transcriptional regulator with XRE-family HTH domain
MQADVAKRLGVHMESLKNWERGVTKPTIRHIPKIVEFLGYNPEPEPDDLAGRLVYTRRRLGLTQETLAKLLRVDSVTLYRWENGLTLPPQGKVGRLKELLATRLFTKRLPVPLLSVSDERLRYPPPVRSAKNSGVR